jgi:hypothetical protein
MIRKFRNLCKRAARKKSRKPGERAAKLTPCVVEVKTDPRSATKKTDGEDRVGNQSPDNKLTATTIALLFSHIVYAAMYNQYVERSIRHAGIKFTYDREKEIDIDIDSTLPFHPTRFSERLLTFATAENAQQWESMTKLWRDSVGLETNQRRIPDELRYEDFISCIGVTEEYMSKTLASTTRLYSRRASRLL